MATIDNLIAVNITQETTPVAVDSFAIPIIIGPTAGDFDGALTRAYTAAADMLQDGYTTASPEYKSAVAMNSGSIKPAQFYVATRTSADVAEDFTKIFTANNTPYGVVLAGLPDTDILGAATAIEGLTKILMVSSDDDAIAEDVDTDVASELQAAGYNRTALVYSKENKAGTLPAAWMGSQLPQTPGSNNWAYDQLPGITADKLTGSQQGVLYGVPNRAIAGKNVNCYQTVGGINMTYPGMMASGRYIDLTVGADWLKANVQAAVFQVLVSARKVPYTNAGVAMLINAVNSVLQQAAANGLLDNTDKDFPIYCTAPNVNSVTQTQRANRIAPTITFGGRLQGAINSAVINGTIAV